VTDRPALVSQIAHHEGCRLTVYFDTVGVPTIGFGRNLRDKGISRREALLLLEHDIDDAIRDAQTFPWFKGLDSVRQRVVIDMVFNLGLTRFRTLRTLIEALERRDYGYAAERMRTFLWYRQVKSRGVRLARMMETGEAPDIDA
jgi:lysozyme